MNTINSLAMFMTAQAQCYPKLKEVFDIINRVLGIIMIAVPILIILWGTIDLLKAVIAQKDDDMKKAWQTLLKRVMYGIAIFLLGTLVYFALNTIGGQSVKDCLGVS